MKKIRKVLVMESNAPIGEKIASLFLRLAPEIEITRITSPLDLVETARRILPDVMLLDIRLANTREQLVRLAKNASPRSSIVLTANDTGEQYVRRAEFLGADGLVAKNTLATFITDLLKPLKRQPVAGGAPDPDGGKK